MIGNDTDHGRSVFVASDQFEGIDPDGLNAACVVGTWEEMEEPVSAR